MADVTPAQLALELGVSAKRVRTALRTKYGTLPPFETRWVLTPEQEQHVRSNLTVPSTPEWSLEPGMSVRRRDLHMKYGGNRQSGIVSLPAHNEIFIFSGAVGAEHGYADFEGPQPDGSFHYTGEGQNGDQQFSRGNKALRDAAADGNTIRLFLTENTWATYVGAFTTGEPTYRIETIPDSQELPRQGIIFHLLPVDASMAILAPQQDSLIDPVSIGMWSPPDASDVVIGQTEPLPPGDRIVSRIEMQLQVDFGTWSTSRGDTPSRLRLVADGVTIEPDLYLKKSGRIVEAKKSISREHVRTAIGQVLDYVHVAKGHGVTASPMVLLPGRPGDDLMSLLASLGITVAHRDGNEFAIVEP